MYTVYLTKNKNPKTTTKLGLNVASTPRSGNPFDAARVANGLSNTMSLIVAAQNAQTPRASGTTSTTTTTMNNNQNNQNNNNKPNNNPSTNSSNSPLNLSNFTQQLKNGNIGGSTASLDLTNIAGLGGLASMRSTSADSLRSNSIGVTTPNAASTINNLPSLQPATSVGSL